MVRAGKGRMSTSGSSSTGPRRSSGGSSSTGSRRSSGATASTVDLGRRSSTGSSRRSSVSSDTTSGQSCRKAQCVARAKTTGVRCKHCVNPAIQGLGRVSKARNSLPVKVATAYKYVAKPHNEYGICYQHVAKSQAEHREPPGRRENRDLVNDPYHMRIQHEARMRERQNAMRYERW